MEQEERAMIVQIDAVAMPWEHDGRRRIRPIRVFAYTRVESDGERRDDSVQSSNHALQIVRRICGDAITEGEPPNDGVCMRLFTVQMQVCDTHRKVSSYRVAYKRLAGNCPAPCSEMMMDIYHAIKRVMREARDDLKARRAAQVAVRKAKDITEV